MGKLHRTNAGYLGVSMEETQDPFWTYNKLALPLSQGETVAGSNGGLPVYNTTDAFGATKGSGTRTDALASSIVLAVPMDGANGGTTFTDESVNVKGSGSAKTITNLNSATTSNVNHKFYGTSGRLTNASDQRLRIDANSDFNVKGGDFTIEGWFNIEINANAYLNCLMGYGLANSNLNWAIVVGDNGTLGFTDGSGSWGSTSTTATPAGTIVSNVWYHFAVQRRGSACEIYVNGTRMANNASATFTSAPDTGYLWIGDYFDYPFAYSTALTGYIQDFRIYKGVAKYTSDFIVPESGPSTLDRSPSRKAVGNAGATWQTSVSKFYGGATQFDGSDDVIVIPSTADFSMGSSSFTLEAWIYPTSVSGERGVFSFYNSNGNQRSYIFGINGGALWWLRSGDGSSTTNTTAGTITANAWHHIALSKDGPNTTIHLNGSQVFGTSSDYSSLFASNTTFDIGIGDRFFSGGVKFIGYIQDARVYKGIAKYTSSFTPPARSLVQTARRYPSGMHVLS